MVDVGGIGFAVAIPLSTFERLPAAGGDVHLHTVLVVREDSQRLYGFATEDERAFFNALQSVSGVGPAVGLGIVSSIPFAAFQAAVLAGDSAQLRRVKGVGKRLSERLVVELKGLVQHMTPGDEPASSEDAATRDALLALEALGFTRTAAAKALRRLREKGEDATDSGDLVRRALQLL